MHHRERLAGLSTKSAPARKWNSEMGKAQSKERQRSRDRGHRKRWGHGGGGRGGGMLMEEAETKKGTDFRVAAAAEEE